MEANTQPNPATQPPSAQTAAWEILHDGAYFRTNVRRLRRAGSRWSGRVAGNVLALLLLLWMNVLAFTSHQEDRLARFLMPALLAALVVSQAARPLAVARRLRKASIFGKRARFGINAEGLWVTDPLSSGYTRWAAFTRGRRFADGWLLYFDDGLAYWLPDACLVVGNVEAASQLIRTQIADCREL